MKIAAYHREDVPGQSVYVEVSIIVLERGFQTTIDYDVLVWSKGADGINKLLRGVECMLPPELVRDAKLKLWEKIKP